MPGESRLEKFPAEPLFSRVDENTGEKASRARIWRGFFLGISRCLQAREGNAENFVFPSRRLQGWYSGSVTDAARAEPWELHRDCPVTSINRDLLSTVFVSRKIFLRLCYHRPVHSYILVSCKNISQRDIPCDMTLVTNKIHPIWR